MHLSLEVLTSSLARVKITIRISPVRVAQVAQE